MWTEYERRAYQLLRERSERTAAQRDGAGIARYERWRYPRGSVDEVVCSNVQS